ncbi:MAG: hypothetical protein MUO73_03230 [Thermoplasmata archaeon]|nr:hypothetical protein [Thermoplasmata archaeon]
MQGEFGGRCIRCGGEAEGMALCNKCIRAANEQANLKDLERKIGVRL